MAYAVVNNRPRQPCTSVSSVALISTEATELVIGCAFRVHRALGPGLFESVYQPCLAHEMTRAALRFAEQVLVPVTYDGLVIPRAFRADFIVENELVVELKHVEQVLPVHCSQVLTYLRLTGLKKGLLDQLQRAGAQAG